MSTLLEIDKRNNQRKAALPAGRKESMRVVRQFALNACKVWLSGRTYQQPTSCSLLDADAGANSIADDNTGMTGNLVGEDARVVDYRP